ncbi:MAG: ABC transporter permease [Planctomycetota bacterium]|nr:ABC transporter permease [Planctomycetota bacterium]
MNRIRPLLGLLVLAALWWAITACNLVDRVILPTPISVAQKLGNMLLDPKFLLDIASSIRRLILGFSLGAAIGVSIGILMGKYEKLYGTCSLLIDFLRSIPAMAFFPMFMLIFGLGEVPKVGITALVGGLVVLFNTIYGVKNCKKTRMAVARIMGATEFQIFTKVVIPEALAETFVGLRLSLSLSLIVVITTEMFSGTESGLGFRIINASYYLRSAEMYAAIVMTGVIGFLVNRIFHLIEWKCIHWSEKK